MLNPRLAAILPWLIGAVLLLLIVARAAVWLQPPQPMPAVEPEAVSTDEAPAAPVEDYAKLAQLHLFGEAQSAAPVPPPKQEIPETRAQLKLHGVYLEEGMQGAIIGEANGRQQFVRAGDSFANGIRLKEVHPDHVVLERSGKVEALRFPNAESRSGPAPEPAPVIPSTAQTGQPLEVVDLSDAEAGEIATHLRAFVVREQGEFAGYRVLPGRNRALYQTLGLRPGDVITAVNGEPVQEAGGADAFLQQLTRSTNPSVTVRRGPETLQLQAGG